MAPSTLIFTTCGTDVTYTVTGHLTSSSYFATYTSKFEQQCAISAQEYLNRESLKASLRNIKTKKVEQKVQPIKYFHPKIDITKKFYMSHLNH